MHKKPSYNIIFDLCDVLFTYKEEHTNTPKQFEPIRKGIILLRTLNSLVDLHGKKRHKLFVLSNANYDFHHNLVTHFPEIFALFDGIVTTATSGMKKPDYRFYTHLLNRHTLDAKDSVFIDDKKANVDAARALGIYGIVCSDIDFVTQELEKINAF